MPENYGLNGTRFLNHDGTGLPVAPAAIRTGEISARGSESAVRVRKGRVGALAVAALTTGIAFAPHVASAAGEAIDGAWNATIGQFGDHTSQIDLDGPHREVKIDKQDGRGTVWQIAKQAEPGENTNAVRDEITDTLKSENIQPGTLQDGDIVPLPLDAQIGHVVDPQAQDK